MSDTKTTLIDLGERVGTTFVEGAAGTLSVIWAASGVDVTQLTDWAADKKILVAVLIGGASAAFSVVKSALAAFKTGTGSLSGTVAATAVPQASAVPPVEVEPEA